MNSARRPCVTTGVALVGAGVIAVTPSTAPLPDIHAPDIQLTAGEDIVIDFVRHADTNPPDAVELVAGNGLPGAPVSGLPPPYPPVPVPTPGDDGWAQATATATQLATTLGTPTGTLPDGTTVPIGGVEGIFGGYEQRMIETASPFLTDEYGSGSYTVNGALGAISPFYTQMDGLDEIGGGIYHDAAPGSLGAYVSELTGLMWFLGLQLVPIPGSNDWLGPQFEQNFGGAVQDMYKLAVNDPNPVISVPDPITHVAHITDVAYSGEGAIVGWTLTNVNNPDLALLVPMALKAISSGELLPPAGVVEVVGNPTDGWTLVSFDGQQFPADPGLLTELFVDLRNLIVAPQTAAWNIFESIFAGSGSGAPTLTTIWDELLANLQSVGAALVQFPESVIHDIFTEVHNLFTDLAAGESFSDAFGSAILGLA